MCNKTLDAVVYRYSFYSFPKVECTYLQAGSVSVEACEMNWKYKAGEPLGVSELQQKAQSKCGRYR